MIKKERASALLSILLGMVILLIIFSGLFYSISGLSTSAKKMEQVNDEYVNITSILQIVRGKSYNKLVEETNIIFDDKYKYSVHVKEFPSEETSYKIATVDITYKNENGLDEKQTFIVNKVKEKFSNNVNSHASLDANNIFWVYLSQDNYIQGDKIFKFAINDIPGRYWRMPKKIPFQLDGNKEFYYLHIKVVDQGACAGLFGEISLPEDSGFIFEKTGTRQIFAEPVDIDAWEISQTGWTDYKKPVKNYCYAWGNSIWYNTDNNFHGTREGFFSTKIINTYNNIYEL